MKGQPCLSAGFPEPYAVTADTYDRLVDYAINQWGESPRPRMVDFMQHLWEDRSIPVHDVLEVCCGTGLMVEELHRRGYEVTGLDRSESMLNIARTRLGEKVPLIQAELPRIPLEQQFDAVVCAAAALNYMPDEAHLGETFRSVASIVQPGGAFVFDILSRAMVTSTFGTSTWAADLGDLAFIWKFEGDASGGYSDLTYTQFQQRNGSADDAFTATRELHRLYALDRDVIRRLAGDAGFSDIAVFDNYSSRPADETTYYETWAMTRI